MKYVQSHGLRKKDSILANLPSDGHTSIYGQLRTP